jgi:hypothetical protein
VVDLLRQRFTAIVVAVVAAGIAAYTVRHFSGRLYVPIALLAGVVAIWFLSRHPGPSLTAFLVLFPFETFILGFLFGLHVPHALIRDLGYWKEVIAAAVIVAAVRQHQRQPRRFDFLDMLGFVYIVIVLLYYVFPHVLAPTGAFIPSASIRQLAVRSDGLFVVLFLAARHARLGREWAEQTAKAIFVVGAVIAGIALYEKAFSSSFNHIAVNDFHVVAYRQQILNVGSGNAGDILFHSQAGARSVIRVGSVFFSPLVLGAWLVLPLAIGVERLARGIGREFTVVAVGIIGAAMIFAQTRSAVLAGVVVILLVTRPAPGRDLRRRVQYTLLAFGLIIVLIPVVVGSGFSDRTTSAAQGTDTSTSEHIKSFTTGVKAVEHDPFGRGLGTAPAIGDRFDITGTVTSENYYLEVGDELGVITMVVFVLLVIGSLRRLARAQRDGTGAILISGMRNAMFGLAIAGFVLHVWTDFNIAITAWSLAGGALGVGEMIPAAIPQKLGARILA